ncbi:MAG: NAD(P)/FAD-dependent oxidoreductase [Candidatus Protistobacter heckmanni]|nr:NAD(P)/FAD-dependent oxidoreductase [Candidatus Protistobacter heckmanni]
MEKVDCVVIGAGVVGLAAARALALAGREVMLLEQHPGIGEETSSRNSEVIHAGLYYPTGSLKARLCLRGREQLYAYCRERGIAHKQCGKLVLATDDAQLPKLRALMEQAHANGCAEVSWLSAEEARALEPQVSCVAALHSPMTGIIDSHGLMLALQGDAENAGAICAFNSRLGGGEVVAEGIVLRVTAEDGEEMELLAGLVVNCAGLWAPRLARSIAGLAAEHIPQAWFAKGNYYSLAVRPPFSRLLYPLPAPGGLGVHLTLDLAGMGRFGPDVEWVEPKDGVIDYAVDPARCASFDAEIRRYWPGLPDGALQPAYSGMRPKISPPGSPAADFAISGPAKNGTPGYIGLYGIESPGLTASLAVADAVCALA